MFSAADDDDAATIFLHRTNEGTIPESLLGGHEESRMKNINNILIKNLQSFTAGLLEISDT